MARNALLLRRSVNNILRAKKVDAERLIKPRPFRRPHLSPRLWPWPGLRPVCPRVLPTGSIVMISKALRVREVEVTHRAICFDMRLRVPPVFFELVYGVSPEPAWTEVPFVFVVRGAMP